MNIKSVYSSQKDISAVTNDIKMQLTGFDIKVLIYFASSIYDPGSLSKTFQEAFPEVLTFGCSTSGEIVSGKMLKNSLVAMAFDSNIIEDARVEVVQNIKEECNVKKAFDSFDKYFNEKFSTADLNKYVGIVLVDGLSASEEKLMDKIGDRTNCTFIGGSAGDDLKFSRTYIYTDGLAYTNSAVLAVLKLKKGFDIIKTQSFDVLDKKLVATKVNAETREVIEFNNKPAIEVYADALGISKENAADYFMTNPVGLIVDGEIFVRSPQRVVNDSIIFYCNILEGMEVSILKSKDIVKDTKLVLEDKKKEMGSISGIVNFNCILRTLELEKKEQTIDYGNIFSGIPTIGFSTYGEEYLGHINQTATILVFK